ncbi:aldehyde dehydrogenase [Laetiporus sulphureus 93-53]|uniref:Aldehyde dehydrogenase n=1 Tax=Laetiporus sulphureus 93-53 TaxID=1314785 RepID=A0A165ECC1_9APHY|nr:aldehyde dehydrogenase [Laetiporus sulphureus 93-53]KZT06718.1 aldehyde dehydrogenase [Laetiporus sulphureus 93-53]
MATLNGSASLRHHTLEELDEIYARLRKTFQAGTTRPLAYRRRQLLQLARLVQDNVPALQDAVFEDLAKPRQETMVSELGSVIAQCLYAAEHLEEWAKPEEVQGEAWRSHWNPTTYKAPKGVVLIIGPWNYPYILTLGPLVGALAAGCPCVVKGSELAPTVAQLLADLFPQYLDPNAYVFVNGAIPETTHLLSSRWDHILFTGSGKTGRIVAAAAAKYATPVTLELGGKSPVVIAEDADLELAAKRVLWGKLQNSGQLCVSPDHVYVPRSKQDAFIAALLKMYNIFWPNGPFHKDAQWGKIVNPTHHARLKSLLERTKGDIVIGGYYDGDRRIAPTIVNNVTLDDALMEDELFGPILPIIVVEDLDGAIRLINGQPTPLTLYTFTNSKDTEEKLLESTRSGALVINDTVSHLAVYEMPFGGQGDSGYGSWYGKASFDTFTHLRGFVHIPNAGEPHMANRYPPYTDAKYEAMSGGVHVKIPDN